MTSAARKVLDAALSLDRAEREEIVAALSESLSPGDSRLSPAWLREVHSRIEDLASGAVEPVTLDEVERKLSTILAR